MDRTLFILYVNRTITRNILNPARSGEPNPSMIAPIVLKFGFVSSIYGKLGACVLVTPGHVLLSSPVKIYIVTVKNTSASNQENRKGDCAILRPPLIKIRIRFSLPLNRNLKCT